MYPPALAGESGENPRVRIEIGVKSAVGSAPAFVDRGYTAHGTAIEGYQPCVEDELAPGLEGTTQSSHPLNRKSGRAAARFKHRWLAKPRSRGSRTPPPRHNTTHVDQIMASSPRAQTLRQAALRHQPITARRRCTARP